MVIDCVTIELMRTGEQAKLVVQGRPYGLEIKITRTELEHLALYLANEVGLWRDEQIEAEGIAARI
jgi:hypothetical protein